MNILRRLLFLLTTLFRRDRFEKTMADEMRFHIEACANDLMRAGMPRDEAVRRARMEFGSVETAKGECRQARGLELFDGVRRNLHYAFRGMLHNPAFTTVVIATLTLGIGRQYSYFHRYLGGLIAAVAASSRHCIVRHVAAAVY